MERNRISSGGALAPLSAADMMVLDHIGDLRVSGRRRLKGFEYIGRNAYHISTVTRLRQPLLIHTTAAHAAGEIRAAADRLDFELLSFVVMPDHVHILMQGRTEGSDLVKFVQRFKQATGYAYKQATGVSLWQWSFYDRIVRRDEDVAAMARYIFDNPVRAGLARAGDPWPYSGGVLVEEAPVLDRRLSGAKAPSPLDRESTNAANATTAVEAQ